MSSDQQLKSLVRDSLDGILPPAPWLGAAVAEGLRARVATPARRPGRVGRQLVFGGAVIAMIAIAVAAAVLVTQLYVARPVPGGRSDLTSAEQLQLAQLEARPLHYPLVPPSGLCPDSPMTVHSLGNGVDALNLSGTGPAYIPSGGVPVDNANYWDVVFYTDTTAKGVVLFRGRNLTAGNTIDFVGQWVAGPAVGTSTMGGRPVSLYAGVAVPADRPQHHGIGPAGWGLWTVRWPGNSFQSGDCVAFQVDFPDGAEMIVFNG